MRGQRAVVRTTAGWDAVRRGHNGSVGSSRARAACGWLVAISMLVHGWLPVLLQASFVSAAAVSHAHDHHADAPAQTAPDAAPTGGGQECPVLGGAICLCAAFVKLLQTPALAAPLAAAPVRRARGRFAAGRPRRQRRAALFDPRAPPSSD